METKTVFNPAATSRFITPSQTSSLKSGAPQIPPGKHQNVRSGYCISSGRAASENKPSHAKCYNHTIIIMLVQFGFEQ